MKEKYTREIKLKKQLTEEWTQKFTPSEEASSQFCGSARVGNIEKSEHTYDFFVVLRKVDESETKQNYNVCEVTSATINKKRRQSTKIRRKSAQKSFELKFRLIIIEEHHFWWSDDFAEYTTRHRYIFIFREG